MKATKQLLCTALAILILFATGCGGDTAWVYEHEGERIPAGLYINFMMYAISEMEMADVEAHKDDADYKQPETKEFLKGTTDGVSNEELVKREAARLAAEYFLVDKSCRDEGVELSQEDRDSVTGYVDYIWSSNGELFEKNGIGRQSMELYQLGEMRKDYLFRKQYGADGSKAVAEEDLRAAFRNNYAKIEYMYVSAPAGEDGSENAEEKAKAEDYFQRYQDGASIEELDYEYRLSTAAEEDKAAVVQKAEGGAETIVHIADETQEPDPLIVAIKGSAVGEPVMVQDDSVYYIFTRLDIAEDPADFEEYRDSLLYEMKFDEFKAALREQAEALAVTANQAAVDRYKPSKVKVQ